MRVHVYVASGALLLVACGAPIPRAVAPLTHSDTTPPEGTACRRSTEQQDECRWGRLDECERQCACNEWNACDRLGFMYAAKPASGLRWKPDPRRAVELYARACAGGSNTGCYNLGNAYERGTLVPASIDTARDLFGRTCQSGYIYGCVRLGKLELTHDRTKAIAAWRRACSAADAEGCFLLGSTLLAGTSSEEHKEGLSALVTGCTRPRSVGTDFFSQEEVSEMSEKACQKWREVTPAAPPISPPSVPARLPSEAPPAP